MTLKVGTRLGPYEVTAFLGSGGMAEVYRARDVRLGREVAIKILPDEISENPEFLLRFEREAKTASALNHPHLVTIYDIGDAQAGDRKLHYMAMELIRGETLRFHLLQKPRDVLLRYIADVADGLARAHDAGIVHRDLKPENIMVSEDNFAKVVDFGLAKHVPGFAADRSGEHLTEEGVCVGTAGYMAPEQVHGLRDMDGRVDIFALGCILYEAIARESPFDGDSPIDTMHRILYHEPPPLRDGAINVIVRRCLAKDRSARYASMRELAADLRNAMAAAPRISTGAISRRPAISSIAVLPFHNRSGNEEMVFLSDGIPEDIVRDLGRIPALRVISSSSASRFRDTTDPQQAARELNVEAVLVGGLRVVAGMVVLDAELVKAADGTALWGKRYTRKLTDIIALEQEIAADLCGEVRLKVAPPASRAPDAEAHEAYLRGQREMGKDTADGLKQGIEYLHRAIEIDPEYALPYAALAMVYSRLIRNGMAPTRDSMHQAVALAHKALALDETLPEAHWPLAVAARIRGDIAEYERLSARVLELNPNFAAAYIDQEVVHALTGRYEEMEATYQHARMLDPLSSRVMIVHASLLVFMRQYDHALEVLRGATEQFPESPNGAAYLAFATSYTDPEAALGMIDQLRMDTNPMFEMWKGVVLARAGRVAEARVIADRTDELAKSRYVQTYYRAVLRCQLGDHDAAFALMEQGVREGEWWFCWLPPSMPCSTPCDPIRASLWCWKTRSRPMWRVVRCDHRRYFPSSALRAPSPRKRGEGHSRYASARALAPLAGRGWPKAG